MNPLPTDPTHHLPEQASLPVLHAEVFDMTDDEPDKYHRRLSPKQQAEALAEEVLIRQRTFAPTVDHPSPGTQLSADERAKWDERFTQLRAGRDDPHPTADVHDLAAVVAGRKPAALVDYDALRSHPVGRAMLKRATKKQLRKATYQIQWAGKRMTLAYVGTLPAVQRAVEAHSKNGTEFDAERGRALGYPEEAVQSFIRRTTQKLSPEKYAVALSEVLGRCRR